MRHRILYLNIDCLPSGDWEILCGTLGRPMASGRVRERTVRELRSTLDGILAPPPISVPGRDARRVLDEELAGRLLSCVLEPTAIATEVAWCRGVAQAEGNAPIVLLDTRVPAVAALPWELLAWSSQGLPVASRAGGGVVRLVQGPSERVSRGAGELRPLLWCPDPDEPTCMARINALEADWRALGLRPIRLGRGPDPATVGGDVAEVLHVLCHGGSLDGEAVLLTGEGARAAGSLSGELARLLRRATLVVLEVCGSGGVRASQISSLAGRLVAEGAGRCVAPAGEVAAEASGAFVRALYAGLCSGRTVVASVEEGRAAVAALRHPHPDHRPNNQLHLVSHADIADADAPVRDPWRPSGWPRSDAALRSTLREARHRAERQGHSWLGVEHLLPALLAQRDPIADVVRSLLFRQTPELWERIGDPVFTLEPSPPAPCLSPRLQRIGRHLNEQTSLEALWRALLDDPGMGLRWLVESDLNTGGSMGPNGDRGGPTGRIRSSVRARRFEVIWGPADGLLLQPSVGQTIGRYDGVQGPDLPVYAGSPQASRLRRHHVRYLGPGQVELLHSAYFLPGDITWATSPLTTVRGPLEIFEDDIIAFALTVWLRGVA